MRVRVHTCVYRVWPLRSSHFDWLIENDICYLMFLCFFNVSNVFFYIMYNLERKDK